MVAVAFALPKMNPMALSFVRTVSKKAFKEAQHYDLPKLELQIFSRQEYFVPGNKCKYPLLVCRKPIVNINPVQCV